jgi:ABC-2 type transport system ATP-binding protein
MEAIIVKNLVKYYGKHCGVKNVSFSVNEGEIFGFVGPNGAGKSTTIRVLLGFIFSDEGEARICDRDVVKDGKEIKKFTGYVPSDVRLYEEMSVGELIKISNSFYDTSYQEETERLCKLFELDKSKRFYELSMGNKKKVSIICALAAKPKVLILDEPTNGLDPMMQKRLFKELKSQATNGVAILLSSHNLSEVQEYCDRVAFIKDGSVITITDLNENLQPNKIVTIWGGEVMNHPNVQLIEENGNKRTYRYNDDSTMLLKLLGDLKCDDFTVENESLENRFMNLYEKGEN